MGHQQLSCEALRLPFRIAVRFHRPVIEGAVELEANKAQGHEVGELVRDCHTVPAVALAGAVVHALLDAHHAGFNVGLGVLTVSDFERILASRDRLANELQSETAKFNEALHDSLEHFIAKYIKDKKYTYILTKQGDNMLYADPALDITKEVVAGLNKAYKGKPAAEEKKEVKKEEKKEEKK